MQTNQDQAGGLKFMSGKSWLKLNLRYLLTGLCIGTTLSVLISAFKGEWIGWRSFAFQLLFSTIITLCITNSIYVSQKLLTFSKDRPWFFILVYYASSLMGMFIAIEIIYLVQAWLFKQPYHFFHFRDEVSSSVVVVIICTIIYIINAQRERLNARIREKDLDMLKLSQLKTQAELATLQSRINPHFLYNSLNAIASLIHEDPDKAEDMTIKLSKLFRYSINQNEENLVLVQEEMDIVHTYLDIEKVRFGNRINFITELDEAVLNEKIPRFLIQPLVENALKHGLNNVAENGELRIHIQRSAGILICISDNGIPFAEELEMGYGLQSTYDKLHLLYGASFDLQILNHPVKQIKIQIPPAHE